MYSYSDLLKVVGGWGGGVRVAQWPIRFWPSQWTYHYCIAFHDSTPRLRSVEASLQSLHSENNLFYLLFISWPFMKANLIDLSDLFLIWIWLGLWTSTWHWAYFYSMFKVFFCFLMCEQISYIVVSNSCHLNLAQCTYACFSLKPSPWVSPDH